LQGVIGGDAEDERRGEWIIKSTSAPVASKMVRLTMSTRITVLTAAVYSEVRKTLKMRKTRIQERFKPLLKTPLYRPSVRS